MKVLLIGANSFTGQSLSGYLQQHDITLYGTSNTEPDKISENLFSCDISKKADIERVLHQVEPDYIINLAGISFVAHSDPYELYRINAFAVENILQACLNLDKKPKKIILASSSIVYGTQTATELSEDLLPKPQNHYGLSKLCMETIASWYADRLNIIITRPFNYTGVNQSKQFLIPKIVDHFKRKAKVIELGNINVYREFNDIEFVCDVYYKFLISDVVSGTYNICTGQGYCIEDILKAMKQITGYEIEVTIRQDLVRQQEISYLVGATEKLAGSIGKLTPNELEITLQKLYNVN